MKIKIFIVLLITSMGCKNDNPNDHLKKKNPVQIHEEKIVVKKSHVTMLDSTKLDSIMDSKEVAEQLITTKKEKVIVKESVISDEEMVRSSKTEKLLDYEKKNDIVCGDCISRIEWDYQEKISYLKLDTSEIGVMNNSAWSSKANCKERPYSPMVFNKDFSDSIKLFYPETQEGYEQSTCLGVLEHTNYYYSKLVYVNTAGGHLSDQVYLLTFSKDSTIRNSLKIYSNFEKEGYQSSLEGELLDEKTFKTTFKEVYNCSFNCPIPTRTIYHTYRINGFGGINLVREEVVKENFDYYKN